VGTQHVASRCRGAAKKKPNVGVKELRKALKCEKKKGWCTWVPLVGGMKNV